MRCEEIEVSLSGFLDGELTQQEGQRVEVHLRTCDRCRSVYQELQRAQAAARALEIPQPSRKEWREMESRILERGARGIGWIILCVWLVTTAAYGSLHYALSPDEPLINKILVFGAFLGVALLFLSVLLERMRERRTDRYRRVLK